VLTQPWNFALPPLGAAVGLGAGLMVALISIQVRDLGRTEEPLSVVFWFAAAVRPGAGAGSAVLCLSAHSAWQWFLLLGGGVLGLVGQLLLTAALRYGQVASVVVMDYSSLIWATLYGWSIWDELPPGSTWLGAPLVIAAGAIIAWREHLHHRRLTPTATSSAE
jgi:drug/metabolite transporter (DMT)-like permease